MAASKATTRAKKASSKTAGAAKTSAAAKKTTKAGGGRGSGRGAGRGGGVAKSASRKALGNLSNAEDSDEGSVLKESGRRAKKDVSYNEESSGGEESGDESDYEEAAPKKKAAGKKAAGKKKAPPKKKAASGKPPRAPKQPAKGKGKKGKLQPTKNAVQDLLNEAADEAESPVDGSPTAITRFTQKFAHDHPAKKGKGGASATPKAGDFANVVAGGGTERKASQSWKDEYEPADDWRVTTAIDW